MGVAGKGVSPHYKFESEVPWTVYDVGGAAIQGGSTQDTFMIYNGLNHKLMTAFEAGNIRDEHWSLKPMSYDDVRAILGEVRAEARG